jgi:DNA-binding NarL/FixJ family response regulator
MARLRPATSAAPGCFDSCPRPSSETLGRVGPAPPPPPLEWYRVCNLTDREREICELIVEGLMAKQVAFALDIAEATVRTHMANIFRKSNVHSRSQLIRRLWAAGMPPPSADGPTRRPQSALKPATQRA